MTRLVEWEGKTTRLVVLHDLPRSRTRSYKRRRGTIQEVVIHQSAGARRVGEDAAVRIARFHTQPPKIRDGRKVGGGKGWPGIGYTFVVPSVVDVRDGKAEVYRTQPDDLHTYHTGRGWNARAVGVCVAGTYRSRHVKATQDDPYAPDGLALEALEELVHAYLLPRYGLKAEDLRGHFDAGKPGCPGDYLEQWVRHYRGEGVTHPSPRDGSFGLFAPLEERLRSVSPLDTAAERQQALVDLGYDLGTWGERNNGVDGLWGEDSRGALEAFQVDAGVVDEVGRWGPTTETAMRCALTLPQWPPP